MQKKPNRVLFFPYGAGGDIGEVMPLTTSFPALPSCTIAYLSMLPGSCESGQLSLGVKQECLLFRYVQRTDRLFWPAGKIAEGHLL